MDGFYESTGTMILENNGQRDFVKRGYLLQDFRIFRLKDRSFREIPAHYHDFHKLILLLEAEGEYRIEGCNYPLSSRDIVFVSAGEVHSPAISPAKNYERIVIYIAPDFLARWKEEVDLAQCFSYARAHARVMHLNPGRTHDLLHHILKLERTAREEGFAQSLYARVLFLEFLILLNRAVLGGELDEIHSTSDDPKIRALIEYIGEHLTEDLDISALARRAYLSKYHLMRKFKQETGCTLHRYIRSKRLLLARSLLAQGGVSTDICYACGFKDYSSFVRAFKEMFHSTPREWRNRSE